ncbi:MAG TPA: DUF1684 domain-containing protein [Bryobacteraceae bacterium]|jgi:hypothetical protein
MMRLALFFALTMPILAADYAQEIADFRAARERSIAGADGWSTLVGLSWLKEGLNRVGADPDSEITLPSSVPARVGTIILKSGHADFRPAPGVRIPAQEMKEDSTVLTIGTVKFFLIRRDNKFGIRVKDRDAPTREKFTHLSWYPVDPSWRIEAKYTPWDKPRQLKFDTVIDGVREEDSSPGSVAFTKDGREYRLDVVIDEGELFLIFRDQTSGKSTYAAARFLYAEAPKNLKTPSTVVLDFNKAINPPCVFTAYATCPLPPPQNRLTLAITAGELMYNNHR